MNKVKLNVVVEKKVDNRVNNTGRPVNKKSARQIRLNKQALYSKLNKQFVSGVKFKINSDNSTTYVYNNTEGSNGYISDNVRHVCNVDYIGRTKVTGFTFVMGKRVSVELNLKTLKFVK